jgi:hypothetical protein
MQSFPISFYIGVKILLTLDNIGVLRLCQDSDAAPAALLLLYCCFTAALLHL